MNHSTERTSDSKRVKKEKRRSLRFKWTAFISAAVFVSLAGSTAMLFATVQASLQDTFSDGNAVQVESATREMRMLTERYEQALEQLAKGIEIAGRSSENEGQSLDLLLQSAQAKDPSLLGVFFISESGGELQRASASPERAEAGDNPLYESAKRNKETTWTDVRQDERTGKMALSVMTPVTLNGEWYGAVGFDIDLSGIGTLRESNEMFGDNKLVIYDNQGRIVSSFMRGMDGKNIDPRRSGHAAGVQDVMDNSNRMSDTFGWLQEIEEGKREGIDFRWNDVSYRGEVSFVYSMNWTVVSFAEKSALFGRMMEFLRTSAIAMALGLGIGALAAYYIATRVFGVVQKLRETIALTAEGNLVKEFDYRQNDEIGDLAKSYNAMLGSMRSLVRSVGENVTAVEQSASGVSDISNENAVSGLEVARSTEEIAAGASMTSVEVEKSSEAVSQLSRKIGILLGQSSEVERVLGESGAQVREGAAHAAKLETSYTRLEEAFRQVTTVVSGLHAYSETISSVTKAIADMTEQTNILSINASIEAARAGAHGKGFAVVADEVRRLADQSKRSAREIQATVSVVMSQTRELVAVVQETNAINETQKAAVSEVSGAMNVMTHSIGRMMRSVQDERETVAGIDQLKGVVVSSMEQISAVTEQTTASTQQIAASIEAQTDSVQQVSDHARRLVELVSELKGAVSAFKVEESYHDEVKKV
ncbi:methyl-accepting chemotaxis protein [Paenibacillus sp. LHD-117]|uniref:methyl-accepting chemotaxis protein n=1 Tax=Paenibacillus sp. LHD-117 TaxID=3071412 RepID=UPI0027E1B57B|nr:methyl-accepting chemotaxis protein [Paenibacillus sp. LHD-117]MDQ6421553.1 methyl-accepting chemotaxis protein [Paenibacillus sp. LHD-117]